MPLFMTGSFSLMHMCINMITVNHWRSLYLSLTTLIFSTVGRRALTKYMLMSLWWLRIQHTQWWVVTLDCVSVSEWLRLLPLLGILALLGYLTVRPFLPKKKNQKDSLINLKIQKENPKVVNEIDIEDLRTPNVCYCRCWRSKTVGGSMPERNRIFYVKNTHSLSYLNR